MTSLIDTIEDAFRDAVLDADEASAVTTTRVVEAIELYVKTEDLRGDLERIVDDAYAASQEWAASSGAMEVHPFDQHETLLGQATLGLELESQAPDIDTVLMGVGGGGLIGGVAAWFAGRKRVIGVEPEGAPTLERALAAGGPVDAPTGSIAADSLAPRRIGELVFPIARRYVERAVLVSDDDIRAAQASLWERARVVAEPGGATAYAALLSGKYRASDGERVVAVVSGGNTVAVDFGK